MTEAGAQASAEAGLDPVEPGGSLARLITFLEGRALGLIRADRPGQDAAGNRARTQALADQLQLGLGVITLAARPRELECDAGRRDRSELTLLLIGPPGDDNGLVKGALRTWGVRCEQPLVLWRPHDSAVFRTLWLHDRPSSTALIEASFDLAALGRCLALLRGTEFDPARSIVEARSHVSFFGRRSTAYAIAPTMPHSQG